MPPFLPGYWVFFFILFLWGNFYHRWFHVFHRICVDFYHSYFWNLHYQFWIFKHFYLYFLSFIAYILSEPWTKPHCCTKFKYKVLYILMIFFYSQNDGLLCLHLGVLNLMLSDTVKFKLIISHNEDRNLNSQCRLKAAGHIFLVEIIFFWSCFLCAKLLLAYRSLLWIRFEVYCRADIIGIYVFHCFACIPAL